MDKLNWTTRECFNAVRALRRSASSEGSCAPLAARARSVIDDMIRRAHEAGYAQAQVQQMTYALVALMDEVVLAQSGSIRDEWSQSPLQLHYFGENTAGEKFFGHLESVRSQPGSVDVLRVYYTCLLLGFQGRYAIRGGGHALSELTEALGRQVTAAYPAPEQLSPYGVPRETSFMRAARDVSWLWVGVGACALSVVLYLGLQVTLKREVARVTSAVTGDV